MNEIQNTPNLRFEGFTEPWRQRKLMEEVTSIDTGKSKFLIHGTGKYEVLGSTSVIGFDDSYDYEGDFLLTARVGANAGELYRHSGKVKISDNTVFIQGEQLDFIYYSLLNFDIKKLSFGTGQPLIKASELKTLDIKVPEDTSEQKKIGELFSNLDSLIALQQRKYERLQHLKQALLRKMFPKPGEQVPELRFEGFTEPWKERRLGDVGHATSGVGFPDAEQGGSSGVPFFKVSDMNLRGNENEMTTANNYVSDSQISRLGWKPVADVPAMFFAKVGAAVALNRKRLVRMPFLMDNNTMAYSLRHEYWNVEYAKALFETLDLPSLAQTGALPSYNSSDVEDMVVLMPFNFDEQQTIGTFFSRLDALIALYQGRHERLQHLKQALLRKMFV